MKKETNNALLQSLYVARPFIKNIEEDMIGQSLCRMYKSEINMQINSFYDAGIDFKLGDEMNGYLEIPDIVKTSFEQSYKGNVNVFIKGINFMMFCAYILYPNSEFNSWYIS